MEALPLNCNTKCVRTAQVGMGILISTGAAVFYNITIAGNRPDSTSGKTFALVPHVANDSPPLQPWLYGPWRKAAEMGTSHSWHPNGY